ncbi:copper transporter 4-like [Hibiscus syriacus]|uniref:copper transporter 4-like n=1 Tax=Hibiscus syriacus TaxID=106335 RepID=UPI001921196E|nr:copper transporter 4-like [Hibiscus syriacus]
MGSMCQTSSSHNTTALHTHPQSATHTSSYWGHESQILFSGWPGSSSGMYALALFFVFGLAMMVECLSYRTIVKPEANKVAAWFFKTAMHTIRAGLSYVVMLAVMSFNGGVFLAAVIGHSVGFLVFGSKV